MELHNARYDGAFKQFAEKVSEKKFFVDNEVFSASDAKRMQDMRFALGVAVTALSTYFNRDEEIEPYLEKYNDEFKEHKKLERDLDKVFKFISDLNFDRKSRIWKKVDLFTAIIEIHRLLIKESRALSITKSRKALADFYKNIDGIKDLKKPSQEVVLYHQASIQATNDRKSRIVRGGVIYSIFDNC